MMALSSNLQLQSTCGSDNLIESIKVESPDVEYTATEISVVKNEDTIDLSDKLDNECRVIKDFMENLNENQSGQENNSELINLNIDEIQNEKGQEDNAESINPKNDGNLNRNAEADESEYEELKNSLTWEEKLKARLRCKICDKEVSFRYFFSTHLRIHKGTLPHECLMCERRFSSPTELKTHILRKHEDKRPFKCKICKKTFKTTHELHVHQIVHSDETHICKICDKKFKCNSYLKKHMEKHQADRKGYFCEICGKTVLDPRTHKVIHNPKDSFTCPECGKQFKTKRSLHLHVRTHSDVRNHVCSDCGKAFKKRQTLKEHQRKHSGIKPYACKVCEKRFNDSGTLSRHKLTHTREHPHACQKCEKTFRYSQQLKNHMKNHH